MRPHLGFHAALLPLSLLCSLTAAASAPQRAFPAPRLAPYPDAGSEVRVAEYDAAKAQLETARVALAARWRGAKSRSEREAVEADAAEALERALVELSNPWLGTTWGFYGTTQTPGQGQIACGYFVTTLLRDAGLKLQRVRLAQQASEYIVRSLAPPSQVWRFRTGSVKSVLDTVRAQKARWFVVGLDLHVGLLLRLDDGEVRFCHASYLPPGHAVCEDAETALAMQSGYHVVGALFTPQWVRRWLRGEDVPSVLAAGAR